MRSPENLNKADEVEIEPAPTHTVSLDGSAFLPRYPVFDIPSPSAPEEHVLHNNNSETAKGTWL